MAAQLPRVHRNVRFENIATYQLTTFKKRGINFCYWENPVLASLWQRSESHLLLLLFRDRVDRGRVQFWPVFLVGA